MATGYPLARKVIIGYYLERGRKKECMYLKVKLRRSKL